MTSVCMASHDGEKFIAKQIKSILEQLDDDDELIISDDGSSDNTIEIIKSFNDCRIQIVNYIQPKIKQKDSLSFRYTAKNFENALRQANGDYIFLSDQDDIWIPGRKEKMISALQTSELAMCNFSTIDEFDNVLNEKFYEKSPISNSLFKNIISSKYLGCCLSFRKSLLNRALPFPENLIAHDYWIGCLSKNFAFIEEPFHLYRRTGTNVSTSTGKSKNTLFYKVRYRIDFLSILLKRKINR